MDDVTLTVTPASAANSLEGTGIRVGGKSSLTQPVLGIPGSKWNINLPALTPRHAADTVALFGISTPTYFYLLGDANNYVVCDWSAANTLRLRFNAGGAGVQTGTVDMTGLIAAGTQYAGNQLKCTAGGMTLLIGGIPRITIVAPVVFTTNLATAYWGSDNLSTNQIDAVLG